MQMRMHVSMNVYFCTMQYLRTFMCVCFLTYLHITGMGIVKRLVEGLRLEYYQTMGVVDDVKSYYALLQLEGVQVTGGSSDTDKSQDKDTKEQTPRSNAAENKPAPVAKPIISLVLDPPVAVCAATAGLLQSLTKGSPDVRLPLMRTDNAIPLWDDLVLPEKNKKLRRGAHDDVKSSGYTCVNAGRGTGGVEVR